MAFCKVLCKKGIACRLTVLGSHCHGDPTNAVRLLKVYLHTSVPCQLSYPWSVTDANSHINISSVVVAARGLLFLMKN